MRRDGSNELGVRLFRFIYARSVVHSCMILIDIKMLSLSVNLLNESNNSTYLKDRLYE